MGKKSNSKKRRRTPAPQQGRSLREITAAVFHKTDLKTQNPAVLAELERNILGILEEMRSKGEVTRTARGWVVSEANVAALSDSLEPRAKPIQMPVPRQGQELVPDEQFGVLRQPLPGQEICDFCSSPDIAWAYPAKDINYSDEDDFLGHAGSKGGWAACQECHDLIEAGDDEGLLERSFETKEEWKDLPEEVRVILRMKLGILHDAFRKARSGPAIPHTKTFTEVDTGDPTRRQFVSPHGMTADELKGAMESPDGLKMLAEAMRASREAVPHAGFDPIEFEGMDADELRKLADQIKRGLHDDMLATLQRSREGRITIENLVYAYSKTFEEEGTDAQLQAATDLANAIARSYSLEEPFPQFNVSDLPMRPKWANARSFNKTWDSLLRDQPRTTDFQRGFPVTPGMMLANYAFSSLIDAHLCVVEPEQVDALEDMPPAEMWRYAQEYKAPWDPMYLDFEGYNKVTPEVECSEGKAKLYGAIVWTPRAWNVGGSIPNLAIAPIGGSEYLKTIGWGFHEDGTPVIRSDMTGFPNPQMAPWFEYVNMGIAIFGNLQTAKKPIYIVEVDGPDQNIVHVSPKGLAVATGDQEFHNPIHQGAILTSSDIKDVAKENVQRSDWEGQTLLHAECIMKMCAKVLTTMFFMDNAPVEISTEMVSRQVRRNAERKGEQIGDIVLIRGKRAKAREHAEAEGTANYSHRFLRRGHFRHLHDERYLKSRPDKVTPCTRMGEAMCPNGECIKVWIDPMVVGDENLPFKAKSHVLKAMKKAS